MGLVIFMRQMLGITISNMRRGPAKPSRYRNANTQIPGCRYARWESSRQVPGSGSPENPKYSGHYNQRQVGQ